MAVRILLVDDDPEFTGDFCVLLPAEFKCDAVASDSEARKYLKKHDPDVIFLDIDLGRGGNGFEFLAWIREASPYIPIIMVTADQEIDTIVQAMKMGAADYVGKTPNLQKLRFAVEKAMQAAHLRQHYDYMLAERVRKAGRLLGESPAIQKVREQIKKIARANSTVLLTGDSGTGKEVAAAEIHLLSERRLAPLVAVNCAALSETLMESELFGHEKWSFTGAEKQHIGKFELTGNGTLFLDEITEIPVKIQAKLLRVIQEREFERVGSNHVIRFSGRIMASTNRNIEDALASGKLREDLYFRLNVTRVHLPPLREREGDISLLADHFFNKHAADLKRPAPKLADGVLARLESYHWPGNVRELSNTIERTLVLNDDEVITPNMLWQAIETSDCNVEMPYEEAKDQAVTEFQRHYLAFHLRQHHGDLSKTSAAIGLSRQGLAKALSACGLNARAIRNGNKS